MFRRFRSLFLVAASLGLLGCAGADETWWTRLTVRDLAGAPVALAGRWTVVVFLSPECPLANASVPVLNDLVREFSSAGVNFLGACADPALELSALRQHAVDYHLAFPLVDDRAQRLLRFTGATYTPEAFVYSGTGVLLYRGRIDDRVTDFGPARPVAAHEDLREVLGALVAGRPAPFAARPGFGCAIPEAGRQ